MLKLVVPRSGQSAYESCYKVKLKQVNGVSRVEEEAIYLPRIKNDALKVALFLHELGHRTHLREWLELADSRIDVDKPGEFIWAEELFAWQYVIDHWPWGEVPPRVLAFIYFSLESYWDALGGQKNGKTGPLLREGAAQKGTSARYPASAASGASVGRIERGGKLDLVEDRHGVREIRAAARAKKALPRKAKRKG